MNWTIAVNVFRLQIQVRADFLSATVLSCREFNSHRRGRHDTDMTVLSDGGVNSVLGSNSFCWIRRYRCTTSIGFSTVLC